MNVCAEIFFFGLRKWLRHFFLYDSCHIRHKLQVFRLFWRNLDMKHGFGLKNEVEKVDRLKSEIITQVSAVGHFCCRCPRCAQAFNYIEYPLTDFFFFHDGWYLEMMNDELVPPKPKALQRIWCAEYSRDCITRLSFGKAFSAVVAAPKMVFVLSIMAA